MLNLLLGVLIGILVGGGIGAAIYWFLLRPNNQQAQEEFERDLRVRRENAEREIQALINAAQQEATNIRLEAEKVVEKRFADIARTEERLDRRQATLDKQAAKLEQREQSLSKRQSRIDKRFNEMNQMEQKWQEELQRVAQMTRDEARQELLRAAEQEARQDMARIMRQIEEEAREMGEIKARKIIATAMQRVASDQVAEITVSVVPLPNDEMKGRIIGRNGRNIRAFEQAAGVDVVVDDTPEAVTITSFDAVRREIAGRALTKLIQDGRIHPARIEKLIKDARDEVNRIMVEAGEQAAYEAGVHGLHREIIKMLGRLKFRTSYGQNQLHHSVEAAKIAAMLAAELGANVTIAKMGALLHDIGKAMDHDQEGTHAQLGADFIKRYNVPPAVVNAVAAHHHEVEQESVEAVIVEVADAISGARPGARRESLENYIKRVRTLEEIAQAYEGVESAYALQAGREIRILVKPGAVDDLGAMRLSKEVARAIEESMQYPGQIQVTVIRETRSVNYAK